MTSAKPFSTAGIEEETLASWGRDLNGKVFCVKVVRTFESDASRLLTGRGLPLFAQRALVLTLLRGHLARRHEIAMLKITEVNHGQSRLVTEIGFDDVAQARCRASVIVAKVHAGGRMTG
jgi:hypothetical protein